MNPGSAISNFVLTGDTSLYLSSGGGFVEQANTRKFIEMGEIKVDGFQNIYQSRKIEEPKLPKTEL
jgi:hypothetical protein